MQYVITFLEGVMSFISPCVLPLLPVYISYFVGGEENRKAVLPKAIFFVLGFTLVFSLLGVFAGTLGVLLQRYRRLVDWVTGAIVILLGLNYLGLIHIPFFKGMSKGKEITGVFSAFVFGLVYSVSLTPCVGAFLGSALMMASHAETVLTGLLLLMVYSVGLGLPFVLSAVLIDRLRGTFAWIKRHYRTVNTICGYFLILVGALMALGWLDRVMKLLL